jgi:indolepyruvate ferredoxin oxidoreductase
MAYKDEYEVAAACTRMASFAKQLRRADSKVTFTMQFHMAPPLLSKPGPHGENPRK